MDPKTDWKRISNFGLFANSSLDNVDLGHIIRLFGKKQARSQTIEAKLDFQDMTNDSIFDLFWDVMCLLRMSFTYFMLCFRSFATKSS